VLPEIRVLGGIIKMVTKKKRQCKIGYSCGASCISIMKECRIEFPEGVSVGLDRRAVVLNPKKKEIKGDVDLKPKRKKEDFEMVDLDVNDLVEKIKPEENISLKGEKIYYKLEDQSKYFLGELISTMEYNDEKIDAQAKKMLEELWNGKSFEVSWESETGISDEPAERMRAVFEAKKMWEKKILPDLEEGTLLMNIPDGGPGSIRDRLYRKSGFGRVQYSDDKGMSYQFAMVINGKLFPVEFGEPNPGYRVSAGKNISAKKLKKWDFVEYNKEYLAKLAKEEDVVLSDEELDIYLEIMNEK
jgi:hypothetical protein